MENFFKKIKFNLTLSRIVMASIIVFLLFYFWGLIFQTKDTVKHVQEQKIQEIKDKNNEKHFRKTFEYGSSELSKNEMNFATSEIQVWVLPDGGFVPKFGSGLVWFLNDGKIYPFYKVGVDIRLKSVQK